MVEYFGWEEQAKLPTENAANNMSVPLYVGVDLFSKARISQVLAGKPHSAVWHAEGLPLW